MRSLEIVAGSWPMAVMFVAALAAGVLVYLIRWFKRSDEDDKAYRASSARAVQTYRDE